MAMPHLATEASESLLIDEHADNPSSRKQLCGKANRVVLLCGPTKAFALGKLKTTRVDNAVVSKVRGPRFIQMP